MSDEKLRKDCEEWLHKHFCGLEGRTEALAAFVLDARLMEVAEMPHDSSCSEGEWDSAMQQTLHCDCYKSERKAALERERKWRAVRSAGAMQEALADERQISER